MQLLNIAVLTVLQNVITRPFLVLIRRLINWDMNSIHQIGFKDWFSSNSHSARRHWEDGVQNRVRLPWVFGYSHRVVYYSGHILVSDKPHLLQMYWCFLVSHMDDLLIFSRTEKEHLEHPVQVFYRLRKGNHYGSSWKCLFLQNELEFFGLLVGCKDVRVDPEKVWVFDSWPCPKNVSKLRSVTGPLQFLRWSIENFSSITAFYTALTCRGSGIHSWDKSCFKAFQALRKAWSATSILLHPYWSRSFWCHVEMSQLAGCDAPIQRHGVDLRVS